MKGSHTPARSLQRPPCTGPQPGPSPGAGALHAGRWPQTRWMGQHARSPRSGACHGEGAGSWLPVLTRARSRGPAVATGACFPPGLPELRPLHVRPRLSAASRGLRHCPTGAWGPATLRPNRPWPRGPYMASTSRADRLCGSVARGLSRDVAQGGEETDVRRGRGRQRSTQPRCPPQGSRRSPRSLALPSPAGPRSSLPLRRVCAAATRLSCQRKTSPSSPPLPRTASPEPPGTARPHGALPQPGRSRRGRVAPGSRRASRSGTTREFRERPHPMWPRAKGLRGEGAGRGWGESLRGFPLALQEPPPGPWEEANV